MEVRFGVFVRFPLARIAPVVAGLALFATTSAPGFASSQAQAASSGYHYVHSSTINTTSADGAAAGIGQVNWYDGGFLNHIVRGDYSGNAKVIALHPVGCIWARVSYGYPTGSITVSPGSAAGTISGGSYSNGMFVSCRTGTGYNRTYPAPLSLAGIGFAKGFLNSTTLEVCTSAKKSDGPRYCSWQKMYF